MTRQTESSGVDATAQSGAEEDAATSGVSAAEAATLRGTGVGSVMDSCTEMSSGVNS